MSASDLKEFTVCGVFAASIAKLMSPALVFSAKVYFAFWSIAISGEGDCFGVGSADGLADGSAAWSFLSESKTPPTMRPTSVAITTATAAPITAAQPARLLPGLGPTLLLALVLLPGELSPPLIARDHRVVSLCVSGTAVRAGLGRTVYGFAV